MKIENNPMLNSKDLRKMFILGAVFGVAMKSFWDTRELRRIKRDQERAYWAN